jgi:hypothetical protein
MPESSESMTHVEKLQRSKRRRPTSAEEENLLLEVALHTFR